MEGPKPNLELDQHFLIDKKVIALEISSSNLSKEDKVIEVGAGKGNLTEELVKKSKEVLAFEVDIGLNVFLDKLQEEYGNLKIIYGDAIKHSWKGYDKLVSNVPYSITEPLIKKAIESYIDEMVLIVGENFKEIVSENKSKAGILVSLFFDFEPISKISKNSFFPKPRVDSWMIKLKRKKKPTKNERILQGIVMKKGKIKNAIVHSLTDEGMTKRQSKEIVESFGLHEYALNKPVGSLTGKVLGEIRDKLKEFL